MSQITPPPDRDQEDRAALAEITISARVAVEPADLERVRAAIPDAETPFGWVDAPRQESDKGQVHLRVGLIDGDEHEKPSIEYTLAWTQGRSYSADAEWGETWSAVCRAVTKHGARVVGRYTLKGVEDFAFPLPMDVDFIPGFSEMRGARLVRVDPEDPKRELYHVIIDQMIDGEVGLAVVYTPMEVGRLTKSLISDASERTRAILDLALIRREEVENE